MSKTDMIRASELRGTLASQGWRVVNEIIEAIVKGAESAALDCDDEAKIVPLQRDARVARKLFNEFQTRINDAVTVQTDDFQPVSY
jgi:hypothetical protein